MKLFHRLLVPLLPFALICATPARADHESASKILGKWTEYQGRMHILKPAATPQELAPSQNAALIESMASGAKRIVGNGMGALVLDDGKLVFEAYDNGANRESKMDSYSMAKSLTALAVGEAFCAGKIGSLEDKAEKYAPAIAGTAYGTATIRQLLSYTSGAQDPGGNGYAGIHSFSDFRALFGHSLSLVDLIKKYGEARFEPGKKFIYNGLDSEALSVVIRNATGSALPHWFEATVWKKAGAEFPAGWFLDRDGNAIAEVAFYATTRDFARIGLYIADRLTGKSADTCMNDFIKDAAAPHVSKGYWDAAPKFGLGLHVGADGNTWMFGHGGQRVGINVKNGRVIAINGYSDWRGVDPAVQQLLNY